VLVEIGVDTDRDGDTDTTITATDQHPIWAADPATVDRWSSEQPPSQLTGVEPLAITAPDPTTTPDGSGSGGGGPPTDVTDPGGPLPGKWVDAANLQPGQLLHTTTGTWTQITTIQVRTQHTTVHNLTVTGPHTYHVLYHVLADTTPVLVHNCNTIDPREVRFSQDSAGARFENGNSIEETAARITSRDVDPCDFPAIRLVERDGNLHTLDNRRLVTFQKAGVPE